MIARVWSAQAATAQAPAYADHLRNHVLPGLRKLAGYGGAMLLERPVNDAVEIIVITYWQSLESIRGFAGVEPEKAVVAAEAVAMLTRFDEHVRHYQVAAKDDT